MLSTRFKKFLLRVTQKLADRWYDGPQPPSRLGEVVTAFANMHPRATRGDWIRFCKAHAREVYRSGYMRGLEYAERDPEPPEVAPERIADMMNPGWREQPYDWAWQEDLPLVGAENAQVPNTQSEADLDTLESLTQQPGRARI